MANATVSSIPAAGVDAGGATWGSLAWTLLIMAVLTGWYAATEWWLRRMAKKGVGLSSAGEELEVFWGGIFDRLEAEKDKRRKQGLRWDWKKEKKREEMKVKTKAEARAENRRRRVIKTELKRIHGEEAGTRLLPEAPPAPALRDAFALTRSKAAAAAAAVARAAEDAAPTSTTTTTTTTATTVEPLAAQLRVPSIRVGSSTGAPFHVLANSREWAKRAKPDGGPKSDRSKTT